MKDLEEDKVTIWTFKLNFRTIKVTSSKDSPIGIDPCVDILNQDGDIIFHTTGNDLRAISNKIEEIRANNK